MSRRGRYEDDHALFYSDVGSIVGSLGSWRFCGGVDGEAGVRLGGWGPGLEEGENNSSFLSRDPSLMEQCPSCECAIGEPALSSRTDSGDGCAVVAWVVRM